MRSLTSAGVSGSTPNSDLNRLWKVLFPNEDITACYEVAGLTGSGGRWEFGASALATLSGNDSIPWARSSYLPPSIMGAANNRLRDAGYTQGNKYSTSQTLSARNPQSQPSHSHLPTLNYQDTELSSYPENQPSILNVVLQKYVSIINKFSIKIL